MGNTRFPSKIDFLRSKQPMAAKENPSITFEQSFQGEEHVFEGLPEEVLAQITLSLDDKDLFALSRTCSSWRDALKNESIWRKKCHQHNLEPSPELVRTPEASLPLGSFTRQPR